jgi:hypothetical protein
VKQDLGRIAQRQAIRGNIVNDDAVAADHGSFPDRNALHDVSAVPDPGMTADANWPDITRTYGSVRGPQIGLTRMAVAVRDSAVEGYPSVFLDHDFAIDSEVDVPTDLSMILDH